MSRGLSQTGGPLTSQMMNNLMTMSIEGPSLDDYNAEREGPSWMTIMQKGQFSCGNILGRDRGGHSLWKIMIMTKMERMP